MADDGPGRATQGSETAAEVPGEQAQAPRADETAAERELDARLPQSTPNALDSTVGTGSVFAAGCSALAIAAIILGIAVFVLLQAT